MRRAWSNPCLLLAACISCSGPAITAERMQADLLGRSVGGLLSGGWIFESLDEFEYFAIVDEQQRSDYAAEYSVAMVLRDTSNGGIRCMDADLVYRREGADWSLAIVQRTRYRRRGETGCTDEDLQELVDLQ